MSSIVVSGDTSGAVTLSAPAAAGTVTVTLPAASGTMASLASVTANGVTYVNSSSQPTSGSALVFDGANLGVGTASPSDMLDVSGNARVGQGQVVATSTVGAVGIYSGIASGSGNAQLKFFGKSVDNTGLTYELGRISGGSFGTYGIDGGLSFSTALNNGSNVLTLSERARIDASGNLGVGTTSITSGGGWTPRLVLAAAGGSPAWIIKGASSQELSIGASDSMYIDCTGATTATNNNIIFRNTSTNSSFTAVERARIDSSGNLLVGTTTGASSTSALMQLKKGGVQWDTGPNGSNGGFNVLRDGTTGVYLTSGATAWSGLSDETMKDIIEPIENASQKISTLRTVIGKYKTDEEGTRRAFLIAQDVKEVLPEAVNENENGKLGLQYTDVMPLLVAAIKEQQALITTLTARITALESA